MKPWRLATLTLLITFSLEMTVMLFLPGAFEGILGTWAMAATDSFLLSALLAPCIWVFMVRPLQQVAESRKQFLEWAIRTEERKASEISRDLHDNFGQLLTTINVGLRTIEELAGEKRVVVLAQQLRATGQQLHEQVRALARVLRPTALDDLGLAAAISNLTHDLNRVSDVEINLQIDDLMGLRFPIEIETAIYRVCQEAISNSIQHCSVQGSRLFLSIEDDGVGFDMGEVSSRLNGRPFGLISMRERIKTIGGQASILSSVGKGVLVEVVVDVSSESQELVGSRQEAIP
jgi:two-component system sensor histidine kinase NreB